MMPARSPRLLNKYIDVTVRALNDIGVGVDPLPIIPSSMGARVVHLHWPEMIFSAGRVSKHRFLYRARAASVLSTIRKVRSAGGRFVWTVHNLKPHTALGGDARQAYLEFKESALSELDTFISLSESGVSEARNAYPELAGLPYVVARHPHYRGLLRQSTKRAQLRQALGAPSNAFVLGCIGTVLPYKGVVEAAESFTCLDGQDLRLLIVGPVSALCRDKLIRLSTADPRIILLDRPLDDQDIADWHSAVDAVLFNGANNLNSGSLLMALSLNRPVLAPRSGVNLEMASLVGEQWMSLFNHPLGPVPLGAHVEQLRSCCFERDCDLSAFDPAESARSLMTAYTGCDSSKGV